MSDKMKEIIGYATFVLTIVMIITFFVTRRDYSEAKFDEKASIDFVKSGDEAVRSEQNIRWEDHNKDHVEYKTDIRDIKKSQEDMYKLLIEMSK